MKLYYLMGSIHSERAKELVMLVRPGTEIIGVSMGDELAHLGYGIRELPALVVAGAWAIQGLAEITDYLTPPF